MFRAGTLRQSDKVDKILQRPCKRIVDSVVKTNDMADGLSAVGLVGGLIAVMVMLWRLPGAMREV